MKDITLERLLCDRTLRLDRPINPKTNHRIVQNEDLLHATKTDFDLFQMKGIRTLLEYDFE